MRRIYKKRTPQWKQWLLRAGIIGATSYVLATGCTKDYKHSSLEQTTEQGIVVGSVQTRIPEIHRYQYGMLAVRDGTITMARKKKQRWAQKQVHEIFHADNSIAGLEEFVDRYWPRNMKGILHWEDSNGNPQHQRYQNHEEYCNAYFLQRYTKYRDRNAGEQTAKYRAIKDTIKHVLEVREEAYK